MQTLTRVLRNNDGIGEALPSVFPSMDRKKWLFRRAQVVMIAAAPNVGKSAFALFLAINMKMPTLYLSADTDPHTTMLRSAAMMTGHQVHSIEEAIKQGASDYYEDMLQDLQDVRFVFDGGPTLEDIDLEVSAFNEVYGQPPELIVVDNLINVQCDDGDEFRGLRIIEQALHQLAVATGACVMVLHHTEEDGSTAPPPRRKIFGKITRRVAMILTLGREGTMLGVSCVKQKSGPADPTGSNAIWLYADFERMQLEDPMDRTDHAVPEAG